MSCGGRRVQGASWRDDLGTPTRRTGHYPWQGHLQHVQARGHAANCAASRTKERALEVDHIVPRNHGGTDEPSTCRHCAGGATQDKGAGDATDFRALRESYAAREPGCPFCELSDRKVVAENPLAVLIADAFPVTEGHMLAIPRRHVADYFDLHQPERNAIQRLLEDGRARLRERDPDDRRIQRRDQRGRGGRANHLPLPRPPDSETGRRRGEPAGRGARASCRTGRTIGLEAPA